MTKQNSSSSQRTEEENDQGPQFESSKEYFRITLISIGTILVGASIVSQAPHTSTLTPSEQAISITFGIVMIIIGTTVQVINTYYRRR